MCLKLHFIDVTIERLLSLGLAHGERKAESEAAGETGSEVAVGTGSEATADGTYSIVSFTFLKKYLVNTQSFFLTFLCV